MAKIVMQGMEQYLKQLENVAWATSDICKAVVYRGAAVVADEIKQGIKGLRTVSDAEAKANYQKRQPTLISVTQKRALEDSFGVAPIKDKYGVVSTKLGFDGYNEIKSDRWPNGQPNQMIARACESGSTAMLKQPFMRPAERKSKNEALQAMAKAADEEIKKITGGNS